MHFLLLIVLGLEAISAQTDPEVLQVLTTAAVYVGELDSAVRSDPLRVANRTVAVIPGAPGSGLPSERCLPGIGHRGWPERLDLPSRDVRWPKRAHGYRLNVRGRNFGPARWRSAFASRVQLGNHPGPRCVHGWLGTSCIFVQRWLSAPLERRRGMGGHCVLLYMGSVKRQPPNRGVSGLLGHVCN